MNLEKQYKNIDNIATPEATRGLIPRSKIKSKIIQIPAKAVIWDIYGTILSTKTDDMDSIKPTKGAVGIKLISKSEALNT